MEKQRAMAATDTEPDRTCVTTAFPPNSLQARTASAPSFDFNLKKSELIVQGVNEVLRPT